MSKCKDCLHFDACVSFWFSEFDFDTKSHAESKKKHENREVCDYYKSTADVVEVVRCRDCNHRKTPNCYLWVGSIADTDYLISTSDDFYCSYGERRAEE